MKKHIQLTIAYSIIGIWILFCLYIITVVLHDVLIESETITIENTIDDETGDMEYPVLRRNHIIVNGFNFWKYGVRDTVSYREYDDEDLFIYVKNTTKPHNYDSIVVWGRDTVYSYIYRGH